MTKKYKFTTIKDKDNLVGSKILAKVEDDKSKDLGFMIETINKERIVLWVTHISKDVSKRL